MSNDKVEIWFTARNIYDRDFDESGWDKYVEWSRLNQLEELVSLDGILNDLTFEPNFDTDFQEILTDENKVIPFFKSFDYVKKKSSHLDYYNLLAVIREPSEKMQNLERDFDFIGYDLIETDGNISALTNCGGFDETFKPHEQNKYGLISEYVRAKEIQQEVPKNNPGEHHAECYLFEIWRHKFIGRNGSFNKEFCLHLEYALGETFEKSNNPEIKGFWCDGVVHKRINKKKINEERIIETTAWIGKDGQSEYEMKIHLGKKSLQRFAKGTPMIDCIPGSESIDWIEIDPTKKRIEIQLI